MPKHPHKPKPSAPAATAWSNVADWYDSLVGDQGSEYHQHVILPGILRLLDIKDARGSSQKIENQKSKIKNILDLACGQGVLCRKLAALGCTVTGLDAAAPLIAAAQKRNASDHLPITYHLADATKLLVPTQDSGLRTQDFLPLSSFDAVTLVLAVQNMTPLSPIWQAARLALKPNGSLIVVMMHPCFRIPQHSDWHWSTAGVPPAFGRQARLIYDYLTSTKIQILTHPGQQSRTRSVSEGQIPIENQKSKIENPSTTHFHRPLQAYLNTLGNAGLLIDHIEEWTSHKSSQPGPKKAALDHSRKEIPMFLAIRARKV